MKSLGLYLLNFTLLAMLVACGKDNESGKSNTYHANANGYGNPYTQGYNGTYPYTNQFTAYPNITSQYSYGGIGVNRILQENPCRTGFSPQGRVAIQLQLNGFDPTVFMHHGKIYAGVTSHGDVGLVIGQGAAAPLFVAYVCQRPYSNGQGQLIDLALGALSSCPFEQLTRATMIIPGAYEPLLFRAMGRVGQVVGVSSTGAPFSFCKN